MEQPVASQLRYRAEKRHLLFRSELSWQERIRYVEKNQLASQAFARTEGFSQGPCARQRRFSQRRKVRSRGSLQPRVSRPDPIARDAAIFAAALQERQWRQCQKKAQEAARSRR